MKPSSQESSKRLIFDRRYGWIYDEWKDPAEEALAGGRGMFCIVPITQALLKLASQSMKFAAFSVRKALENPEQFSPQAISKNLSHQSNRLMNTIDGFNSKLLKFQRASELQHTFQNSSSNAS